MGLSLIPPETETQNGGGAGAGIESEGGVGVGIVITTLERNLDVTNPAHALLGDEMVVTEMEGDKRILHPILCLL
jgi:hypothetical protein